MEIPAPFLKNLLDYASYQALDVSALNRLLTHPVVDLCDPDEMVLATDYLDVLKHLITTPNSRTTGLHIGAYLNLNSLGLVLDISLSTSSLKQGIYILEGFLRSKFPLVSSVVTQGSEHYELKLESSVKDEKVKTELLNMTLCIVYRELKLMLPAEVPLSIRFPYSKKEDAGLFFTEEVTFSSDHVILLPKNMDELEINEKRVKDIELLLPKFVSMLNQNNINVKRFSKNVRGMALNMCNPEIPSLKQVQEQFACSERTFQRRLTAEGTSYRQITNEIKKELAYYLSNEKHLRTKDIAYILGYSGSSAYLHALKEWKEEPN
ncbi:MAG: AraC family transcriptional regulator ligand-binding domain-containing protein [Bacteroidia bacterium]|nr:AraC family transcriptional regulator ligand-binding domain-containing protein [Bacteroidia bacterium]